MAAAFCYSFDTTWQVVMREWCLGQRVSHQSIHQRRLAPGPSSSVPHRRPSPSSSHKSKDQKSNIRKKYFGILFFNWKDQQRARFVCSTTWKKWPKLLKWNFWNIVGFQGNYSSKQKGEGSPICGMFLLSIFFPFPHCLKITQNVSFEILNFGIFPQFLSY